ncbi:putative secreted protein [Xanthomonas euvesicatoria pv. vesicatoria str. 85-10]|uniref:Putative secreted protein n=1 Tax=Xanthomonas euvesicatoria pv. vesicatoria (strain 85-10) TaxID=316273 RepID=Q3BXW9_XANE5|nr:putative secreted protein [Xanthomonas euvesicatoria pv. vesicatoria str. 85-10]
MRRANLAGAAPARVWNSLFGQAGPAAIHIARQVAQANCQCATGQTAGSALSTPTSENRQGTSPAMRCAGQPPAPRKTAHPATSNRAVHLPERCCTGTPALPPKTHRRPLIGKPTTGARMCRPVRAGAE